MAHQMTARSSMGATCSGTQRGVRAAVPCATRPSQGVRLATAPQLGKVSPSRRTVLARAEGRGGDSNFLTGFVLGGVVFGTLGFLFAPQISKALLGDDQRLRLPRFLEDEASKDPEATKQDLIEKIAQLNASIDEVAAKLEKSPTDNKVEIAA